jgi:hypothetical protein
MKKFIISTLLGFLLLISCVSLVHATITYTTSVLKATATASTCVLPVLNATAGQTLVVTAQIGNNAITATAASTNSDTWSQAVYATSTAGAVYVFYAPKVTAGNTTTTITLSGSASASCQEAEYAGLGTVAPLDVTSASSSAAGTALKSGSSTTHFASELLIGGAYVSSTGLTFTQGTGFTLKATSTIGALEYEIVASAASYSTTMTISTTTAWIDTLAAFIATPTTPGTPSFGSVGSSTMTVSWTSGTNSTYYSLTRATSTNGTYIQVTTTTSLTYNDTGLTGNTSYWYKVNGVNTAGSSTYSASSTKLMLPGAPGTPSFASIGVNTTTINWTAPTGGATYYSLARATSSNGTYVQVTTTTGLTYGDSGLAGGTSYWYEVSGINATGNGSYSATSTVTTTSSNSPPNAPSENSPANGVQNVSTAPTFLMTATDPDSNSLQYKVIIYSNSGCTSIVQTDDESASQTGWSGQNTSSSKEYTSGTQGSFTVQSALSQSTTYYWTASAKDPEGTNTWTNSVACNSFTTTSGIWTTDSGSWAISSNELVVTPGSGNYVQLHVTNQNVSNDVVEFKVSASSGSAGDTSAIFRADASSNRYQLGDVDYVDQLERLGMTISNSYSTLSSASVALSGSTFYDVRSYANGSSLESYIAGSNSVSTSDSTLTGAGFVGLGAKNNNTFTYKDFALYTSPVITISSLPSGYSWSALNHAGSTIACTTSSTWDATTYNGQLPLDYDNGGGSIAVWSNANCSGTALAAYPSSGFATDIFGGDTYLYNSTGGSGSFTATVSTSTTITVSSVGVISN